MDKKEFREWFINTVNEAEKCNSTNTCYFTNPNEQGLSVVIGWEDGYVKQQGLIQKELEHSVLTLCAKVAYNCDDLQCDYEIDWHMPIDNVGDVCDTSMAINDAREDADWFYNQLEKMSVADLVNN